MAKGLKAWGSKKTASYLNLSRKYYWNNEQLSNILGLIPLDKISHALDVGTGNGFFAFYLSSALSNSAKIIGIDIDSRLLETAKKNIAKQKANVTFKKSNVYKLPFKSDTFDLITEQLVLLHLTDPLRALNEICRCLKPNGYTIFIEPNNTAVSLVEDSAKKELSQKQLLKIIRLEMAYRWGKKNLDKGDSNIGDNLSMYLSKANLKLLSVHLVDRVNNIEPPYSKDMVEIFNLLYGKESYNQWHELYRDYCIAGGLDSSEFVDCWKQNKELQEIRHRQFKKNKYYGLDTKLDYVYLAQK